MRRTVVSLLAVGLGSLACDRAPTPADAAQKLEVAVPAELPTAAPPAPPPYDGPPKTVLVELFSSQGCNSCPDADEVIAGFGDRGWSADAVVPLTFHVTYWDDLGWSDPFASSLHDQRQIGYGRIPAAARASDETTIDGPYTPQMIVDGRVHFSGSLGAVAKAEIERARQAPTPIDLQTSARVDGSKVKVEVRSVAAAGASLDTDRAKVGLFAALAQRQVDTVVPRGENAGKTLTEYAVVRRLEGPQLFRASRENTTSFALEVPDDRAFSPAEFDVVVFAQDLASLQILATRRVPLAGT